MKECVRKCIGKNVRFIDIDTNPEMARSFGVRNIPTTILVKDGVEVSRFTGSKPAQQILESYYNGYISINKYIR